MQDNLAAVATKKERKFRQYMNRRGGFNRQAYFAAPSCFVNVTQSCKLTSKFISQAAGQDGMRCCPVGEAALESTRLKMPSISHDTLSAVIGKQ